ncbi:MAG TPA: glycosyltransferase family 4 protein [Candidatus Angelobacter sp.]|jgi:glycosyltransferase involved in cell wall biosynthesis|nr:glycosyltransferase family 4 protein [Candidatus Angelobacter sp.]
MNLTLVISSLERGGAERVISVLAGAWVERGRQITLITFDDAEGPAYQLHPGIVLRSLHIPNEFAKNNFYALHRNVRRVRLLRRLIRQSQPDVVLSFLDFPNIITLLATRGLGIPVIVSERANPEHDELKPIWKLARSLLYPQAAALVCQTNAMLVQLQGKIKVRGHAIPNPVEIPATLNSNSPKGGSADSRTLVAMGRLVPQKGFDLLLEAFARIAGKYPAWSIKILGKGALRSQLQTQAESLGLKNRVSFAGAVFDPFPILRAADLFVFSSRFEGFGNALTEAMACGLAAISFDCPAGPSDIIRHGVDGLLVPPEDVAGLASAMDRLMGDTDERERLARRAPDVLTRFSLDSVIGKWEKVLNEVLPSPAGPDNKTN